MFAQAKFTPLFLQFFAISSLVMIVPAIFALAHDQFYYARTFFYTALLGGLIYGFLVLAMANRSRYDSSLDQLFSVVLTYLLLPIFLAIPVYFIINDGNFDNAWFDMISAFTTTGLPIFSTETLPQVLHLWRALVGWMGGALIWVSAAAILMPLNLGGFEITAGAGFATSTNTNQGDRYAVFKRTALQLIPIYIFLTWVLWIALVLTGYNALDGFLIALSVISTSGLFHLGGLESPSLFLSELVILIFFAFALSRRVFSQDRHIIGRNSLWLDHELRLAGFIIVSITMVLVVRHWIGFISDESRVMGIGDVFMALWGALFTVTSFLTTMGVESVYWKKTVLWSGLNTPDVLFLGLAMFGGGVATTAGGVKLMRVFVLYVNARQEMDLMLHPSSIVQNSKTVNVINHKSVLVAWVFFMLFAVTLAAFTLVFSMALSFENSLVLAIATLTTTGPLIESVGQWMVDLSLLFTPLKVCIGIAMVLGRLEILVLLALVSPSVWQK